MENLKIISIFAKLNIMKRLIIYRMITLIFAFLTSTGMANNYGICVIKEKKIELELLYDNIWGTIYHAEERECDDTPMITGNGSKINPTKASEHRWIAITQEMLNDDIRYKMLNNSEINRFKGKIKYGDTVWIESQNKNINGYWVVNDTKHSRVKKSIDFLQTKGDKTLYDANPLWSGRFLNIKIYKINNYPYSQYHKKLI